MRLFAFIPLALLSSGCQMLTHRTNTPDTIRTVVIEENKVGAPVAYVVLPGGSSTGMGTDTIAISPKTFARVMERPDPQLEADIRAFSRMSKKSGGPAYALLPPLACAEKPAVKRGSKAKEPVCYTAEDEGRVVVYMARPEGR